MFPKATSVEPFSAARMFTISSGKDVPKATIVSPITSVGTRNFLANEEEPSIRKSAPFTKNTIPIKKSKYSITMLFYVFGVFMFWC